MNNGEGVKASLAVCNEFLTQCGTFKNRMCHGRTMLMEGIEIAHAGWKDAGYDEVHRMAEAIASDVESIEEIVAKQVIPYVDDTIKKLESDPYGA